MKGSTPSPHAELDRLIAASHEGQLTYADRDRLERLLQEAGARQRYRAVSTLHASLVYLWHHQPGEQADDGRSRPPASVPVTQPSPAVGERSHWPPAAILASLWRLLRPLTRPTPLSLAVATITIGGILAGIAALRLGVSSSQAPMDEQARPAAVATVAAVHQAAWQQPGRSRSEPGRWLPGDVLFAGERLRLKSGLAEIAFFSGGKLVIEGPAEIMPTGRDAVRVAAGRIVVRTTHGPRSEADPPLFTVQTPRGVIEDLGTEFGVDVPADGGESVHVFEGVVVVAADGHLPAGVAAAGLRLEAGTSAAIDGDCSIRRISQVAAPRFVRNLPEVPRASRGNEGRSLRPAPWHGENVEEFPPVKARFVRFTVFETVASKQPCLDELEIFATDGRNVAREGTATASGTLPGHAIHAVAHVNDGLSGNDHSWICDQPRGWIQIELAAEAEIDRIVWSRDRTAEPRYVDRVPIKYLVSVSLDGEAWQHVAHGSDRLPFGAPRPQPEPVEASSP